MDSSSLLNYGNPFFQMGLHLLGHVAKTNPLLQMGLHLLEHFPPPLAPISLSLCKRGDFQCCEFLPFLKKKTSSPGFDIVKVMWKFFRWGFEFDFLKF
jgi:hypothetical protein